MSPPTPLPERRARHLARFLASLTILIPAGCGGAAERVIPAPVATTPVASLHRYASAPAERDKLLTLAKPGAKVTSQGAVAGWPPANGSAIPATPTDISGFGFNRDRGKKDQYLAFAVSDTAGGCAGGAIVTNAKGTTVVSARPVKVPSHVPCTGDEVAKLAGSG